MFANRKKVEQDLERIRRANLPDDMRKAEELEEQKAREELKKITPGEIFAMIIAVFAVIGPYVLAFFALISVMGFLLTRMG